MMNIWNVVFANLVAENATWKAELQRLVNLDADVTITAGRIDDALTKLVMSESKVAKWQDIKRLADEGIAKLELGEEQGNEDGEV